MKIVTTLEEWRAIRRTLKDKTIGFVPTMGNLHGGHMSLFDRARAENDITVVSVFVNPAQFNLLRDFDSYPRTFEKDQIVLGQKNIDYVLHPPAKEMFPDEYQIQVVETNLSTDLEGRHRPGHFIGMLTIVLKFLNLVQPERAYFGEKDYQQLLLVQKMVKALFLPVEIIACTTVRSEDGLALSSRNSRLKPVQRQQAMQFAQLLLDASLPTETISDKLSALGFKVDYIVDKWQRRLGAVWLDDVRLIDNYALTAKE